MIAATAGAEDLGDGDRRHRHPIRGPLGFQPVAGLLPDQLIDQFEPLGLIDRFRQHIPVTMVIVARFLLTHGTPRTRA